MNLPGSLEGKQFGPYTIEREIARGGQGVVLRARQAGTGRLVALKILGDPSPTHRKRFLQEAQVLARLDHPHVIQVRDSGELNGMGYMALDLIEGQDLATKVETEGVPDFDWTRRVLAEVADTLHYCHGQGIVHRDVKPANVLIEEGTGRVLLVDFGMVRRDADKMGLTTLDEATAFSRTGELKGTPAFMAPEQINSGKFGAVSGRTDVYALGGLLFYMLTGTAPFAADILPTLMVQILSVDAEPASARNPDAPADLVELAALALAKEQDQRPESAAAFARALRGEGIARAAPKSGALRHAPLLVSLALNGGLAVAVAVTFGRGEPKAPGAPWEEALERARGGQALAAGALDDLERASAGQAWAEWLPFLRAQSALDRGALDEAARRIPALPEGAERAALEADLALARGDVVGAFERALVAEGAALPWRDEAAADGWAARVEPFAVAGRVDLAARAALQAGRGRAPAEAVRWIGRAFALDAREAAANGAEHAPALLEAASAVLTAEAPTPRQVAQAREWLVWYRYTLPREPIPALTLDALWALGSGSDGRLRDAAFPGCARWADDFDDLRVALTTPLTDRDRRQMSADTRVEGLRAPWRKWITDRANHQNGATRTQITQTFLLWRPDFPWLWGCQAWLEEWMGHWSWLHRCREVAAELEEYDVDFVLFRLGAALRRRGQYDAAVAAFERGLDAAGSTEGQRAQWGCLWLAETQLDAGRPEAALRALDLVTNTWMGTTTSYWLRRRDALRELGRAAEAAEADRVVSTLLKKE